MVSTPDRRRVRKRPEERRAEIVTEASRIALDEGLERITLRSVAERLDVRPGLVNHYFPAVEDLLIAALAAALAGERDTLVPAEGHPMHRLARLVARVEGDDARDLARLWLNARHLCRFSPTLTAALQEQEALDRERFVTLVEDGVEAGAFTTDDTAHGRRRAERARAHRRERAQPRRIMTPPRSAHWTSITSAQVSRTTHTRNSSRNSLIASSA